MKGIIGIKRRKMRGILYQYTLDRVIQKLVACLL